MLLQSATAFLLQSAMVCYYKVGQVLLQSATGITKCVNFITKCDRYYKVRQYKHVVVVQNNGKEMYKKSVLHVQSCFFAN